MNFQHIDLTVKSFDNINLHYRKNIVNSPKAVILISHGLAEHCGRYDYVTEKLNSFGYSVYRYDHRGHGFSDGRRGFIQKSDDLFTDSNTLVDLVKSENPGKSIFMLGHSLGGHTLAGFGCTYKDKVDGMILCSSLICDSFNITDIDSSDSNPYVLIPEYTSHNLTHDLEALDSYDNDSLILENITIGMYNALKESCHAMVNNLSNFNYPCLILHGSSDSIVSCEDSKFFYSHISSNDKEITILNGLYHKLLDDIMKDEILEKISNWIKNRIK